MAAPSTAEPAAVSPQPAALPRHVQPVAAPRVRSARVDWWVPGILLANLAHVFAFSRAYPQHRLDPDLLAYFTFYRNWVAADPTLHGLAYYTGPKALLVFTLGALNDASAALACTAVASAALGVIVYLVARDAFGRAPALAVSCFLLLDPSKAFLTLKSSADLYLAVLLFLAILLADRERLIAAALCLFLSALIKPVTLPCATYFLAAPGSRRRRCTAALIPFAAVPFILLANHALLGSAFGGSRFFGEFASMAAHDPLGPGEVVHYAVWSQLIKNRFVSTASWGLVGLLLWVADDRARLNRPLLLMPLLFLCGYVGLSALLPFPPYFRYFWPLEVWMLAFVAYGAFEGARRLAAGDQRLRRAIIAIVLALLADGLIGHQLDYQRDYAAPIERSLRFAAAATDVLQARTDGSVVAPLGLLPYLMWRVPAAGRGGRVDTAERLAREQLAPRPDWIIDLPRMYKTEAARQWIATLAHDGGYQVYGSDGESSLLVRPGVAVPPARENPPANALGGLPVARDGQADL